MIVGLSIAAAAISWGGTGALRRYALSSQLLDVPNARSSHQMVTPRGGGLAIVLAFALGCLALWLSHELENMTLLALGVSGGLVAVLGFVDDRHSLPARWRLLGHFVAAIWAIVTLSGLGVLPTLLAFQVKLPVWLVVPLAVLYLVWLLNLYNFMDGIDGIAAVEAISVCLSAALLYGLLGQTSLLGAPLLLAAAVSGFLAWNFPPARIFMGDVGSGFVGLVLGMLSLQAAATSLSLFSAWLILLGVFIVDASWTLLRRLSQGKKPHEAHRSHAYQWAARRHRGHRPVTLAVVVINGAWLLPIALLVGMSWLNAILGLLLAYGPLLGLVLHYRAGTDEVA